MRVKFTETVVTKNGRNDAFATPAEREEYARNCKTYKADEVYDLPEDVAKKYLDQQKAVEAADAPEVRPARSEAKALAAPGGAKGDKP